MIRRQHIVCDFFGEAAAMRAAFDARFKDPYSQSVSWEYFCAPQMYTYLRTPPQRVIPAALLDRFIQRLRYWCIENLGLVPSSTPYMHLMVNGCTLGLHSDFHNGAWGYVYSLTNWQTRKFAGGETLLMRDGVPSYKKHQAHGEVLYELVPAHFNQLLIFDDRIVHGTPVIQGSMDPLEGRIALVGHLRAAAPLVCGPLDPAMVREIMMESMRQLRGQINIHRDVQGTATFRLAIAPSGEVESVTTLTDKIITALTGYDHSPAALSVKSFVRQAMSKLRFPTAAAKSTLTVAILIPLPDLRHIDVVVPHASPLRELQEWAKRQLRQCDALGFQADWDGDGFLVQEPVAGKIRIEVDRIAASFDPPMWVPSQREQFQASLIEHLDQLGKMRTLGN